MHVYDSASGKQISELPLGAPTTGGPSMYEFDGRQYLLVTASTMPGGRGAGPGAAPAAAAPSGPTGIIAYALPGASGAGKAIPPGAR